MRFRLALAIIACSCPSLGYAQDHTSSFLPSSRASWHDNSNWSSRFGSFVPTARVLNEEAFVGSGEAVVERLAPEVVNLTIGDAAVVIEQNGVLPVRSNVSIGLGGTLHVAGSLSAETLSSDGTLKLAVVPGQAPELDIATVTKLDGTIEVLGPTSLAIGEGIELFSAAEFADSNAEVLLVDAPYDPALDYRLARVGEVVSVVTTAVPHVVISRATGRTLLKHTAGDEPVTITGYTLRSDSLQLLPEAWRPIGQSIDGWIPANPTTKALSELSLNSPYQFEVGTEFDLGIAATAGVSSEDATLRYVEVDGAVRTSNVAYVGVPNDICLLYTSPSPRDLSTSRMPSSA